MEQKTYYFEPPLYKIIQIVEEKGYDVVPYEFLTKFKVQIFYNGHFLHQGTLLFDTYFECLDASYRTLLKRIK